MSSNEEDYNDGDNNPQGKKRRIQRACDICRRKKIRCDGVQMPGNRCSNCIAYSFDCTYIEAAKKRGPPKGYVESLENRLERMEKLLHRLCPDKDVLKGLEASLDNEAWSMENLPRGMDPKDIVAGHLQDKKGTMTPASPRDIATSVIRGVGNPVNTDDIQEEDFAHLLLVDNLKKLSIDPRDFRFFGKSSGAMLVQTAMELKNNYTGETHDLRRPILASKRPEFWEIRPWERKANEVQPPNYKFPDEDLVLSLVELYFNHVNLLLPLLHRPTFEKAVAEGLHQNDEGFGANLLLVCAVASRYSEDPRILLDGEESYHSSGWKWFNQVQVVRKSLLAPPTLYDLQFYCLSVQFLLGSSAPQSCWTMIGIGIRLAQDVGAHRRKFQLDSLAMEDEMWKRAFWVLICMDRMVSSSLGRPCAIQDEDFDVDFPVECDDEYWDHDDPEQRFKQPVITICLRTIYSINKSKVALGFVGQQWEQHIVAELDSALNKWVDSVPDYLRWDPNREDKSHIIDIQRRRDLLAPPQVQMVVFTAGIVLLLNIWGGKRSGLSTDPNKEMADVYKCMQVLRSCENRWHSAGRLWDILYELASVGDLPLPKYIPISSNKRERDSDSPASASATGSSPSDAGTDTLRPTAGSRRIARDGGIQPPKPHPQTHHPNNVQTQSQGHMQQEHEQSLFALPVYSDELGRLPLHGQVKFSPQGQSQGTQIPYWYPTPQSSSTPINSAIPPPNTASASYTTTDINMPGPFSIDGLLYDQMGINYSSPFPQSSASASSSSTMPPHYPQGNDLGVTLNPTGAGAGAGMDPHTMAMMHSGRFPVSSANTRALIDSDTIAMWNAPTGFELDDWGTYLTSVSELTHGFQHPPGDQQQG